NGTPQALVAIVEDDGLPPRNCPGGIIKFNGDLLTVVTQVNGHAGILLPVTELRRAVEVTAAVNRVDPMNIGSGQMGRVEMRVVVTLPHVEDVLGQVLTNHKPGLVVLTVTTDA